MTEALAKRRFGPSFGYRPRAYGPSDFTKFYGKSVDAAEVLPSWLGGNLAQACKKQIFASPAYRVTPDAAPAMCMATDDRRLLQSGTTYNPAKASGFTWKNSASP